MHDDRTDHDVPEIPGLTIGAMVGRGGHGAVYAAHQHDHDRPVAVKVLNARLDTTARRRFDRERLALGRVSNHPGVVTLISSGTTRDRRAYLVLEWASGGTLAQLVDADGCIGPDDATALGIQVGAALEQSHRCGVLHRDVTPGNVMRSEYGRWLLADFGVAAFRDGSDATETISVTFAHCAPESFDSQAASPAADVYSLASVIRTALTGEEPNAVRPGETMTQAMARVASTSTARSARDVMDRDLADVLADALDLDPSKRPTMRSFTARLAQIRWARGLAPVAFVVRPDTTVAVRGPSTTSTGGETTPPAGEGRRRRAHRPHRRSGRRARGVLATMAVLGGLGAGGLTLTSSGAQIADGALTASAVTPDLSTEIDDEPITVDAADTGEAAATDDGDDGSAALTEAIAEAEAEAVAQPVPEATTADAPDRGGRRPDGDGRGDGPGRPGDGGGDGR